MSTIIKSAAGSRASMRVAQAKADSMMVWQPSNNKQFETFSYLPPLTDSQIAKQVDYLVENEFIPCLEFADEKLAYVSSESTVRFGAVSCNYYDNRYWTMWKLPMFGCTDANLVLKEIAACTRCFPNAYVRLTAFDNHRQVQIASFLVHRPKSATDYTDVKKRSVKSDTDYSTDVKRSSVKSDSTDTVVKKRTTKAATDSAPAKKRASKSSVKW